MIPYQDENISLSDIISAVYPSFDDFYQSDLPTLNKAIVKTKNNFVDYINSTLIQQFLGDASEYISTDRALDVCDQATYADFLNSLTLSGFPPHHLELK